MATNPVFVNPEPLPRFDGEGGSCDAETFVEEARRRLGHYRLADGAGAEYVLSALTGCARAEILSRPADDRRTGAAILDLIQGEFGDKRDLVTLLSVFHGRRQGKTEGVYQYAHAVLAAAARVNAKLKDHLSEDLVRDRFADGLHPPELRRDVRRLVTLSVTVQPSENTASAGNVGDDDADRMAGHTSSAELSTWVPVEPACRVRSLSVEEICRILDTATIYFIGDSLTRHTYTAFLLAVRGNELTGAMLNNTPPALRRKCSGLHMFTEQVCRKWLDRDVVGCNGKVEMKFLKQSRYQDANVVHGAVQTLRQNPNRRSIVVLATGLVTSKCH
nr:hypothetical protein BaRGS_004161 [Batillaria attramentaria]